MIQIAMPMIGLEEAEATVRVLNSGIYVLGPETEQFENEFADFVDAKYGVACSNGSCALMMALKAHGVGSGDFVVTTAFSFFATASMIKAVGAIPLFADIDPSTYNISPTALRSQFLEAREGGYRIKAIIPVHLYGQSADMREIEKIAGEFGAVIVEDACQAHGAKHHGELVGSKNTACWSFYPTKNMTVGGDGGMVTTNDQEIAHKLRLLRSHGAIETYKHVAMGYNFRLSEVHAAIGRIQLRKLPQFNALRQQNARYYDSAFEGMPFTTSPADLCNTHVYHQYTIWLYGSVHRNHLREYLKEQGIIARVYYPEILPSLPEFFFSFKNHKYKYNNYPKAQQAADHVLSLPVHPGINEKDLEKVVKALRNYKK